MPKKSLESLTESMFYVLMALQSSPRCGTDIALWVKQRSQGRIDLGPATLYTILAKFEKEEYIQEIKVEGRKRTYKITAKGTKAYTEEIERLTQCLEDAAERQSDHEENNMEIQSLSFL